MQGINLNKLAAFGFSIDYDWFDAFFFQGSMPQSLDAIPFDLNYISLIENSVYYNLYGSIDSKPLGFIDFLSSPKTQWRMRPIGIRPSVVEGHNEISPFYIGWKTFDEDQISFDSYPERFRTEISVNSLFYRENTANNGFNGFSIGRSGVPLFAVFDKVRNVTGFSFDQNSIEYRYGGARYRAYAYATSVDFYYWSDDENEGAGGFVLVQRYENLGTNGNVITLDTPIQTRAIKIVSRGGSWGNHPGHATFGNPQWNVKYLTALTDEPVDSFPSADWLLIVPRLDSALESLASTLIDKPIIVADISALDVQPDENQYPEVIGTSIRFNT
tara:strand:- start:1116 stop:2102 length:987 start_codon:yes stop_codon:yes gene_type:complete